MSVKSAGILLFRFIGTKPEVFLVHPGGPFWAKKDEGAWSIPKGVFEGSEDPLAAAKREFKEETGFEVDGDFIDLDGLKQPGGKKVYIWAIEKDVDAKKLVSNTFTMEWPKNSGNVKEYPEVDKGEWFGLDQARKKILKGQAEFLDRLVEKINSGP